MPDGRMREDTRFQHQGMTSEEANSIFVAPLGLVRLLVTRVFALFTS
jgi:hypothetical protein